MVKENEASKIFRMLKNHEKRISALEKRPIKTGSKIKTWYKSGSTIEKIILLIEEGFFRIPRTIGEIISELKTKDYHLRAPDLTLPLRKVVRKELLKKTKINADGSQSKNWLYVKV